MLRLIQTLMKTLHAQRQTMGSSGFMALFVLVGVAYLVLSLQLLIEFIRSQINRSLTRHDDLRAVQSWDKPHIDVALPQQLPVTARIRQTRETVTRRQHDTEQRVGRRVEMLRKRIGGRRMQHA